jgi:hypothetical protein
MHSSMRLPPKLEIFRGSQYFIIGIKRIQYSDWQGLNPASSRAQSLKMELQRIFLILLEKGP